MADTMFNGMFEPVGESAASDMFTPAEAQFDVPVYPVGSEPYMRHYVGWDGSDFSSFPQRRASSAPRLVDGDEISGEELIELFLSDTP